MTGPPPRSTLFPSTPLFRSQRRAAAVVGLDPADVPASVAEMKAYYTEMRGRIWACREAREGLLRMFNPNVPRQLLPLKLAAPRSEEHTSELQSPCNLVCRLL